MVRALIISGLLVLGGTTATLSDDATFLKGADISLLDAIEKHGGVYRQNGKATDPLKIFADHGCNSMRVRLFHAPTGIPPTVNDLEYTISLGRRIKKGGMRLLLDIHYSDTWADPGKQTKPAAWKGLECPELEKAVFAYTENVVRQMCRSGATPDIVQIGNEIGPGMLWDSGRTGGKQFDNPKQWRNLAALLNAGIAGVHAAMKNSPAQTMVHIHCGGDLERTRNFFEHLESEGVNYDLIGLSYYAWWHSKGRGLEPLRENLDATIKRFGKDVVVVETAYPWFPNCDDATKIHHRGQERPLVPGFPASVDGQREYLAALVKCVRDAPDGRGIGVFYWAPEYIATPKLSPGRAHLSLFDKAGNALPGLKGFRE